MIKMDDHIILGISGGPDSIALLHIMKKLKEELNLKLAVAHVNHVLRPEADEEEATVKDLCSISAIPFYSYKIDVAKKAQKEKRSVEEVAREVRYQFFRKILVETKANLIATAHHQDDNAETVLLNLLRGSGIKGLRGILPVNGDIIRPLLGVSKVEIETYLEDNKLPYFIDQSNFDPIYLRNKIRNQLIPLLKEEYNPRIIENLNQLAIIAKGENEVLELESLSMYEKALIEEKPETIILNNIFLTKLNMAICKRVILRALSNLAGEKGWEAIDVDIILDLMTKEGSSKTVNLKKGVNVSKVYDKLIFSTLKRVKNSYDYLLSIPSTITIPDGSKYLIDIISPENFNPEEYLLYIDYDKCNPPLHLRSRKPGDFFSPYGFNGTKKIKDFFIDLKIPSYKREDILLLTDSRENVYAVLGYRVSSLAPIDNESKRILVIKSLK